MNIHPFFDPRTYTVSFVVWDGGTKDAIVIDPVLDYEPSASKTWTESADQIISFVKNNELTLHYILETHAHADHLSGAQHIKAAFPDAKVGIGEHITAVQSMFKGVFDLPEDFPVDGRQFDTLLKEGETFHAGTIPIKTWHTPGHTPACVSLQINDMLFTGDLLFMPDMGTGRCDFPGGSSADMYRSIEKIYSALPDETRVFVGHDYAPGGRSYQWETTLGDCKRDNVWMPAGTEEKSFVERRDARDKTLAAPKLLFQSVQVNVDGGHLPEPHANEIRYLKIPINVFRPNEPATDLSLDPTQEPSLGATR